MLHKVIWIAVELVSVVGHFEEESIVVVGEENEQVDQGTTRCD